MLKKPISFNKYFILFFSLTSFILSDVSAQSQNVSKRASYISQYSELAVSEMRRSGIPASITMAQAILESNIGRSDLATVANNHFGIKCHVAWEGKRFYYDDDEKDECFRVYENPVESFRDHSIFLLTRDRYKGLFDLDPLDYKAWARGLKSAGYATNPRYAPMLIKIIEEEKLYQLDKYISPASSRNSTDSDVPTTVHEQEHMPSTHTQIPHFNRNRIEFVIVGRGETVRSLTEKLNMLKWEIRKYNELERGEEIREGIIIYLQPKRKRAAKGFSTHIVKRGESVYSISQHFGVKTKWIRKRNNLRETDVLRAGEKISLRGNKPKNK